MSAIRLIVLSSILALFAVGASAQQHQQFFEDADRFFKGHVNAGLVDYTAAAGSLELDALVDYVEKADLSAASTAETQAFYINAYNLLVIDQVREKLPLQSVQEVSGFFDRKLLVAGDKISLNEVEKNRLIGTYGDARYHFVLVCAALGCPTIADHAYFPAQLEEQLEARTRLSINDDYFTRVEDGEVLLSQIFRWYEKDFGANKAEVISFLNRYLDEPLGQDVQVGYYTYDWTLNQQFDLTGETGAAGLDNNSARYVVSAAIPKGGIEVKLFNNLYTQRTGDGENLTDRATFFSSNVSAVFGVSNRLNIGFDLRYRSVSNDVADASPLGVFGFQQNGSDRHGLTNFGPKIRWSPTSALPNFSVQSAFWIPVGSDLEGSATQPYIDWDGPTWWTQFFNDFDIGSQFALFTEIDFLIEDIGGADDLNRISTPASVIFSYFPSTKATIYALTGFSPYWQQEFDYFAQAGVGAKYQFTPQFEIELLYTGFTNKFLQQINGTASTYNIGFRFSR